MFAEETVVTTCLHKCSPECLPWWPLWILVCHIIREKEECSL